MLRLIEIAELEKYDEFKVEINSKMEVLFEKKKYMLTDTDIVDPADEMVKQVKPENKTPSTEVSSISSNVG